MRVGFITAHGPGMGHLRRCDALRNALEKRGHEIQGFRFDDTDCVVVDDPSVNIGDVYWSMPGYIEKQPLVVLIDDYGEHECKDNIVIRPYTDPELAWVDEVWRRRRKYDDGFRAKVAYCQMGMSPEGKALAEQISEALEIACGPQWGYTAYDCCVGAPGHSSWERCTIGQPTLQIIFSESQVNVANAIEEAGAGVTVWNCLEEGPVDESALKTRIEGILSADALSAMSDNARHLCDGKGAERTVKLMEEWCKPRTKEEWV